VPVRPIRSGDHDALNALHRSVGWPERSPAGWRWLEANPARLEIGGAAGWVLTDQADRPVAMVGNFIQRFRRGDRTLHGATGFSIIVPPERKGASRNLIRAFLAQPGMFARYTLNANARSAPIYGLFGLEPFPVQTAGMKLAWIVDALACSQGRILRRLLGGLSAETARRWGERLMNGRLFRQASLSLPAGVERLHDLSDRSDYARFWEALVSEGRTVADRSPEMLRWRLADPDQTLPTVLLALRRSDRIVGVAMARMAKLSLIEPPSLEILDISALETAPDAVETLAGALIANARALGAAKVRLQMVSPTILAKLGDVGRRARREGGWGHCHALIADRDAAAQWSPTPFDGDYAICNRPVPPKRARNRRRSAFGSVGKAAPNPGAGYPA